MECITSSATVTVAVDKRNMTLQDVRDWLAEVDRLKIPDVPVYTQGNILMVMYKSQIVESTLAESQLGVEGYDILVGLPR